MESRILFAAVLILKLITGCKEPNPEFSLNSNPGTSIRLLPSSNIYELARVPRGAVGFTASIKNEGTKTITIAHPSICFPAEYKQGEIRRFRDSHGKSEILLKIRKPSGTNVILRDGYLYHFDPGNFPLMTILPNGTGTFHVGWFFENARGRWERDDEAARMFLVKGEYGIRILFRNLFPMAAWYDEKSKEVKFIDVWTGEMESPEIAVEVK